MEQPRILIVEQNRRTVGELHDRLVRQGFETEVALSGEGGLSIVHERDMDAAVVSHLLSGFAEWELLRMLRRNAPDLPIVLINGPRRKGISRVAHQAGATRFLCAPANLDRVVDAVATILSRQLEMC